MFQEIWNVVEGELGEEDPLPSEADHVRVQRGRTERRNGRVLSLTRYGWSGQKKQLLDAR